MVVPFGGDPAKIYARLDTWIALVNERPNTLGAKLLKAKAVDEEGKTQPKEQQERTISLSKLQQYGFDVRTRMGNLLQEKFKLKTLAQIIVAYQETLGDDHAICKNLSTPDLRMLHAARNVLVHLGGFVDAKFVRAAKSHPRFSHINDGDMLCLSSEQVLLLTDAAFSASTSIVFGAVEWLEANGD